MHTGPLAITSAGPTSVRIHVTKAIFLTISRPQDLYSYDLEQSRGQTGNNIVTVLMKEKGFALQESVDYIGKHCDNLADQYLSARKRLPPSLGPDALHFIDALGDWMIGNLV